MDGNLSVADLIQSHDVYSSRTGLKVALAARFGYAIVGCAAFLGFEAYMNAARRGCAVGIADLHVDFGGSGGTPIEAPGCAQIGERRKGNATRHAVDKERLTSEALLRRGLRRLTDVAMESSRWR